MRIDGSSRGHRYNVLDVIGENGLTVVANHWATLIGKVWKKGRKEQRICAAMRERDCVDYRMDSIKTPEPQKRE